MYSTHFVLLDLTYQKYFCEKRCGGLLMGIAVRSTGHEASPYNTSHLGDKLPGGGGGGGGIYIF